MTNQTCVMVTPIPDMDSEVMNICRMWTYDVEDYGKDHMSFWIRSIDFNEFQRSMNAQRASYSIIAET